MKDTIRYGKQQIRVTHGGLSITVSAEPMKNDSFSADEKRELLRLLEKTIHELRKPPELRIERESDTVIVSIIGTQSIYINNMQEEKQLQFMCFTWEEFTRIQQLTCGNDFTDQWVAAPATYVCRLTKKQDQLLFSVKKPDQTINEFYSDITLSMEEFQKIVSFVQNNDRRKKSC